MPFSQTIKALSDPQRQKIIKLLKKDELSAGDILKHLSITGASLSHHLAILKQADLVSSRRDGQQIIYSLNLSVFDELLESLANLIK